LEKINIGKAAYPIPDKEGLDAAKEIKMIAEKTCDNESFSVLLLEDPQP